MTKLYSTDAFELLLGISEGEIGGVVGDTPEEKRQNIFIDDTPLYDSTGNANFDDSSLVLRFEPGTPYTAIEDAEEGQTPIWYAFGGRNISVSVDKQLDHSSSVTELTPTTTEGFDAIEVRFYIPQLVRYTDDGSKDHTLELRIEFRKAGETSWQSMEKTIEGKASAAPISRSFKFPVTRTSPDDRFEIRVTKLTEESTDKKVANVSWVGYELFTLTGNVYISDTLDYDDSSLEYHPGTAMLQVVGVLGQQLDRVPTISAVYDGLLCTIPSNYDPVTKTYDETVPWDGTFKTEKATTDNPLWIAHELIINTRMGLARHNPRIRVDRYSVYEKAKYADGYNPLTNIKDLNNPLTGETGVARYTFNAVISQQQDGMDLINQIVGTAFGRAIDNDDGEIQFLMDMPTTPAAIITPEMCLDDSDHYIQFTYSFSDLNERFNAITSSILDKRQEYQQRFISEIRDEASINKYGLNQHEFKAVGCTDEWECQRRMYFFMNSVLTEVTTVTFRMPLNSIEFELSDVVYLVDPNLKHGLSGRMVYGNVRTLQVRDPLYFDEAADYELTLQGIEQDYIYTITIAADEVHTPLTTFTLSDDLPSPTEYNDYPVVSISNLSGSETPVGFPKPWRISSISEIEDNAGFHEITAVEINPGKHSAADLLTVTQMPEFSFQRPYRPTKVQNLRVLEQEHIETVDAQQVNLWVGWDEQEDLPAGAFYEVTVYENTRAAAVASFNVQESAVEIPNISRGEIRIRIVTWFGSLRSGQVFLNYNTENVLVAEMAARGIAPLFTTSYENDALEVFAELRYNYGSSSVTNIDLIAAGTVQGIRYTIYDDRDPQNRNLLTTLDTNGPLLLGPQDFYKLIGHGDYTPSSLFIEAQVIDVEGARYPADGQTPFELTVSPDAAAITSLTYNKVLSGTTYHRVTWADNNYGYEVTLFKPDGKSVLSKTVVYDNEFSFGVLPEGTNYSIQVRGFNSSRAYGNPETILFSVAREITPTAEPAIVNNEGTIVVTPPEPTSPQASYEFKYGLVDNITTAVDATRGTSVTINNTVNNADYYIWYRLVSLEGKGSWIKKTIKADGQTLYTWKVYADDESGTGISTTADTKPFVGILSGQLVATPDISDPSIYAWLRNTSTEWLFGSGAPASGIGNLGDSYLEQSTGDIYKKTASGWGDPIGNLQGGDGDKFWSTPYHPDDANNPYQGSDGDLYINTLTFELYQKVNGTWTLKGVLKGTDGTPGADGKDAAYFRGFETTEEQDEIQLHTGVTKQAVNDSFSGTVAMEMSSTVVDGETGGAGDTGYLTIPEPLALLFAGQKCLISVIAKQGSGSASPEFGLAYSTSDVGNSGWSRFTPTTAFVKYSFEYELPLPNSGGTDFLIINPDMSGGGGTLIIDHVQVTIKGEKGDTGDNAQLYYIGYPNGLVIKNGVGSINLETHLLDGSEDSVLTGSSDPQLYDGATALGRSAILNTSDINGSKVIQLKNGNTVLDSVTVTDLFDGDSAVTGTTSYSNTLAWTQEKNGASSWLPSTYTSDITFTFYKDGATIATRVLRATLTASTGKIAITNVSSSGQATSYAVSSNGTASVSITVTHTSSGVKATERVLAVKSGEKGDNGISPSVGYLEEEATSFLALADGSLESGQFPYTNKFTIYEGQTDVTTSWTLSVAHSGTVNWSIAADGTITVNNLTSDKATLSVLATQTGYETVRKKWTLIKQKKGATGNQGDKGDKGDKGDTGPQGVAGPKGADGQTTYTWIRYADTSTGGGISNSPSGKKYIGLAHNKTTAIESNTASDYTWSLIKGDKGDTGVQGPQGPNGQPTYTWIKYSPHSDGTSLTDSPQSNTKYIGIAPNKTSASESNNKSDYTWSAFKGEQGDKGDQGDKGEQGERGITADAIVGRPGQTWGFKNDAQGWSLRNGTATYSNGKMIFTGGSSHDVGIVSPTFTAIKGDENYAIRVRVRTTDADHSTSAELYYTTQNHGQTGSYYKNIPVEFKQNEWQYLVFDMRELTAGGSDWMSSDITRIRVDFSNSGTNRTYEIDGVVIGYFGAADETDYDDDRVSNEVIQPPGIAFGAAGTLRLVKDSNGALTEGSSPGEVGVSEGVLYFPDGTSLVVESPWQLTTPFEGNNPRRTFFIVASKVKGKARFGSSYDQDSNLIPAYYENGQWYAQDNTGSTFMLMPLATDVVIARGRRAQGESITILETMIALADQTDYDDDRVNNGKLKEADIRNGAGWAALPSSGATRNTGAFADLDSFDLNNASRTFGRLRLDRSNLESLNSRLTLGSDGFMVYKDANNQDVALGNVTPSGIGAAELDELIEASQAGGLFPDPTFRNLPSRGNDWYFGIWADAGTPRSNITHDGSDLVWELLDTAQSGIGFSTRRGGATYYIPAKKGETFAAKVVLTADTEIINFAVQINERNATTGYAGTTSNIIPMQNVQGQQVELSGSVTIQEETAAYLLINVRVNYPDTTHSIKIHSLQVYRISDAVANDRVDSNHIKGKMAWTTAPADGANKVELDGGGDEGQMRGRFNGASWFNIDVFSSGERTKLNRLRQGQMPGDSNKYINRWNDVDGDGRPDSYATVTGAASLAIDPTFQRGFISIDDANDWHLEDGAGEFDDAALVFHGNNTRDNTKYTWLAREPQNGNYLDIPAKKGDRFKFVIRYACWGSPVGNFGFNVLGKDKNGTNSEYLSILNQGNVQVGASATDFKTLETTIEVTQSITKYVQFYFYANQNMTQGSILFDNVEIWKIPASIDNDSVDENHIKGKMSWTNAPEDGANKTTNTNQLTDGAELGKKADWSGVTGTGKPADNANKIELYSDGGEGRWSFKTNGGATQYIDVFSSGERTKLDRLRQGQLPNDASKYMNQWASVYGSGKPANDANKTDVDGGGAQGQMRYRLNNGSWVNVDVFSSDERTKLDNLRQGKLPDGSRDVLDRDLATLNTVGRDVIDGRANTRIDAKRPDSTYKNENTTKAQVGLSNVDNKSSSTIRQEAVSDALSNALLRNPSGEGINFLNPRYANPKVGIPLVKAGNLQNDLVRENRNIGAEPAPVGDSVYRMNADGGDDAWLAFTGSTSEYNMAILPNRKWVVSAWVYRHHGYSAVPTQILTAYMKTPNGYTASVDTVNNNNTDLTWQTWVRVSWVVDLSGDSSTEAFLRIDNEKQTSLFYVVGLMVEPQRAGDNSQTPSTYVLPPVPGPILNAGNNLPMATLAGASATVKDISGGTTVLETAVYAGQAQIFINTHTVQLPDKEVTFNSDDITVSQNVRYFIYCDDPYGLGGSVTYYAVTDSQFSNLSAISGRYWLGSITSASSSNPGGGGAGDYECVAADMYLEEGLQAGEVSEGQVIDAWSPAKGLHKHPVLACPDAVTECVRLITEGGAVVVSTTTPIDLKDGRTIAAINALGEELLTVSTEQGEAWLPCIDIEYLAARRVIKINVGDESYPAGESPDFRIVTHNAIEKR